MVIGWNKLLSGVANRSWLYRFANWSDVYLYIKNDITVDIEKHLDRFDDLLKSISLDLAFGHWPVFFSIFPRRFYGCHLNGYLGLEVHSSQTDNF